MSLTERQQTLQKALSKFFRQHYATDPNMTLSRNVVSHNIIPRNRGIVLDRKFYNTDTIEKMLLAGHGRIPHSQRSLSSYINNPKIRIIIRKVLYKKIFTSLHTILYKIPEDHFIPIFFDMLNNLFGIQFDNSDVEDCIRRKSIPTDFMSKFTRYIKQDLQTTTIPNLDMCAGKLSRSVVDINGWETITNHKYTKSIKSFLKQIHL